jgi:cystathionine gamma-synthase
MAERGLFTFALRHAHACASAARLADALAGAPGVARVIYPGRADHPDRARAARLLAGGGNMVSFELAGGRPAAEAFVSAAPGLAFAPTLGDVATTLSHPASSSHREITEEARRAIGISEGFFRVSVGLEPAEALVAEVMGALQAAASA